ncbi:MAG: hypothetical protein JWM93_3165, partial [Frankiales bacterium]|nr:hypothetical protein [Frankiales bacterium]
MTMDDAGHEHLSLDEAADFDQRLLDGAASADVAARVASCAACAGTLDAIVAVRGALGGLPTPAMPADVARRLHAALAAEARSARVPGGAATVTALPAARVLRGRSRWLPAAVGIAAVGVVAIVVTASLHRDSNVPTAGSAASPPTRAASAIGAAAGVPTTVSGSDYGTAPQQKAESALSDSAARAAGGTAFSAPAAGPSVTETDATPVPAPSPVSAPATIATPEHDAVDTTSAVKQSPDDRYAGLRDPVTLDACVARLIDPDTAIRPTLIDYGSFNGEPAIAVYFPSDKAGQLDVFVVGVGCGPLKDDLLK